MLQVGLRLLLIVGSLVWLEQLLVSWPCGYNVITTPPSGLKLLLLWAAASGLQAEQV
jgi:hypothetical protein